MPVDALAWLLRKGGVNVPQNPLGGSDWAKQQGLMADVPQGAPKMAGEALGLLAPMAGTNQGVNALATALRQGGENMANPAMLNKQAGAVLMQGNIPPKELLGQRVTGFNKLPKDDRYDSMGNLYVDMQKRITPLANGNFLAQQNPVWGSKEKPLFLVSDNLDEAYEKILQKSDKSLKAVNAAEKAKFDKSVAGMLEKEYGKDVFSYANSNRSASRYITHNPSGQKIRISDHDLPLGYASADLDIPISASNENIVKMIKNFLEGN
jgi:hypothetical protein